MFKISPTKLLIICSFALSGFTPHLLAMEKVADSFDTDPRHLLVRRVQTDYLDVIKQRKALLGTADDSVALVDIARERLEHVVTSPADYDGSAPDWSLVIRSIVSGYGDKAGVDTTAVISEDEQSILCCGFALSSAYEVGKGKDGSLNPDDIYSPFGNKSGVLAYAETFNKIASLVPEEVYHFAAENLARLNLASLHTFNAWYVHERFWAVAGVLDPKTSDDLRKALGGYNDKISDIGFVNDLAKKLDLAILSASENPKPKSEEVVELIKYSQQILLTLSAGLPTEDGAFVRLAPKNPDDWQVIRKALFLALSVTSNPESGGRTFLSTLYNCGEYFHKKTDPDQVKEYYWQLEAYANGILKFWSGVRDGQTESTIQNQLIEVIDQSDPLYGYLGHKRTNNERGSSYGILRKAYETALKSIPVKEVCKDLAAALLLHPKLKHEETFRTLYPDLTSWATYHSPSLRARELVSGEITDLNLSKDFQPQAINLVYQGGKWKLNALKLDNTGKTLGEAVLWNQGGNVKESFAGSLTDPQGAHLFSFAVDGPSVMVKAISTGYLVKVGGVGSSTTVANGTELGIIESSAYPLHADIYSQSGESSGIFIEGTAYNGMRGIISALRESVWMHTPTVNLRYDYDFEVKTHNGKHYNFYSQKGQGIQAHKDVVLYGDSINLARSSIKAGQDAYFGFINTPTKTVVTHGSNIQAGHTISVNHGAWEADTQTVFSGSDGSSTIQNPADLTPNSHQAQLDYGRFLSYSLDWVGVLNDEERNTLVKGPHAYGAYNSLVNRMPTFKVIYIEAPRYEPSYSRGYGGGFGSFGGSSFGSGFISNNTGWGVGPKFAPTMVRSQPLTMSSMSYQGSEFSLSNRGGTTNIGGSISFSSMGNNMNFGNTRIGFDYSRGDGGGSLGLTSKFTPPSLMESVQMGTLGIDSTKNNSALNLHMLSSAAILQMTAPKQLNMVGGMIKVVDIADKLRKVYQAGKLLESSTTSGTLLTGNLLNETGENDKEAQKEESKSNTLTGGPKGEGPDDKEHKKEEKKPTSINQMQQLVEKDKVPNEIKRFDRADHKTPGSKDHVHFKDGTSMNIDGSIHDKGNGIPNITNKVADFLKENGWAYELLK
jgi:hypothetical protein